MTPEREKYLANCGKRELWLRSEIRDIKRDIYWQKQIISNANEEWLETGAKCELWHKKQLLMTLHNELNRLKGMDRVAIPKPAGYKELEWYCKCGEEVSDFDTYCSYCGKRLLWDKVKQ